MLWFLRKVFGVIALIWVIGWLLSLVSCVVNPKAAASMLIVMYFSNIVGIPASIAWTVLKVINVLSERRVERPATVMAMYPKNQIPPSGVLRLATPAPIRETPRTNPVICTSLAGPDVYTYSAPGMPMCQKCGQRPAIFYCSIHQTARCLECVAKHDEPKECVYVPAFRAPKPAAVQATTSGPAKPRGSKPTSVLGID